MSVSTAVVFVVCCATLTTAQLHPLSENKIVTLAEETSQLLNIDLTSFVSSILPTSDLVENKVCRQHSLQLLAAFLNLETWALQMVDSSAKLQSGILDGNIKNLGQYDECVNTRGPDFAGQYCLASVEVAPHVGTSRVVRHLLDKATLGRLNREITINRTAVPVPDLLPSLATVQLGVCVPSSCSPLDVQVTLSTALRTLERLSGLRASVYIEPSACSVRTQQPWTLAELAFICVLSLILILVVLGTTFDVLWPQTKLENTTHMVLTSFSLRANWRRLVTTAPQSPGSLTSLDGLRIMSTLWVILGHKGMYSIQSPLVNKSIVVESLSNVANMPMLNRPHVDTFLMLSGLLKSHNLLRELQQGRFNYISCFIRRYLRLTPMFALMVTFYATLLPRLSSGPAWHKFVEAPSAACRSSWPLNLLYVHNYVRNDYLCMVQSWYLAADMQLHLLAPLLVIPIWRWPHRAPGLLLGTLLVATAIPLTYIALTSALPLPMLSAPDIKLVHYATRVHFITHNRAAPFVVGISLGYILFRLRGYKVKLNQTTVVVGWSLCLTVLYSVVYGVFDLLQYNHVYNAMETALFGALHRPIWAIAVAWIVFACQTGNGGWIAQLLNARVFQVLSRLSYCVFFSHFVVLMVNVGRVRTAMHVDEYSLIHSYAGDVTMSITIAMLLHLFIEAPMAELTKMLLRKGGTPGNIKDQLQGRAKLKTEEAPPSL